MHSLVYLIGINTQHNITNVLRKLSETPEMFYKLRSNSVNYIASIPLLHDEHVLIMSLYVDRYYERNYEK